MQKISHDRYTQLIVSRNFMRPRGGVSAISDFVRACNRLDTDLHQIASSYGLSMSQCSRLRRIMLRAYYVPRIGTIEAIVEELRVAEWHVEDYKKMLSMFEQRELQLDDISNVLRSLTAAAPHTEISPLVKGLRKID